MLWDLFPSGRRLGGAPVNFAYHCRQLGAKAYAVSRVGSDELGREIQKKLKMLNVERETLQVDSTHPTGTVKVTLDEAGHPSYEICERVAWDYIEMTPELKSLAGGLNAACFGSLAQRNDVSRKTIVAFLEMMPGSSLRIFDVNLRQAYYSKAVVEASLRAANVLKLSDEELPVLSGMFGFAGPDDDQLHAFIERFGLKLVALTCGARGSLLVSRDARDECPAPATKVVDTVGAGDSFTAALCMGMLKGHSLAQINDHANRVASFVCSQSGATPVLPKDLL